MSIIGGLTRGSFSWLTGTVSKCCRDMAVAYRFLEGCRAAEITHAHCHTDGVFSQQSIFVVGFSRSTSLNISTGGDRLYLIILVLYIPDIAQKLNLSYAS
jgi:hypothetical protein